jgi:hypothetical protein
MNAREQGRRRVTAVSAGLLAAGVTGTLAVAGYAAWSRVTPAAADQALPNQQSRQSQPSQPSQQGGFPQVGGAGGPGQAGSGGS